MACEETVVTTRLEVRPPREADRLRFVELLRDDAFMAFSHALTEREANARFDHMLTLSEILAFSKRPIVERVSGVVVGYTGVDHIVLDDHVCLEWGYRLVAASRGRGYATEASQALLAHAGHAFSGEILAIIDAENHASQNVSRKLGFTFLKRAPVEGAVRNLYTLTIGEAEVDREDLRPTSQ